MYYLLAVTFIVNIVNVFLVAALLYPSVRNFYMTRSAIAGVLMLFIVLFLAQNVTAIYFHVSNLSLYTHEVDFELATLTTLESFGLGALLWVTYK
jgi:hypothetical protein